MLHRLGLLFLIFTVANICVVQLANGDEALIKQVCDATPAPDSCKLCFIQDTGAVNKDVKGLAGSAIQCFLTESDFVTFNFEQIRTGVDDPAIKDKCARCEKDLGDAVTTARDADSLLKNGRFPDAANRLAASAGEVADCSTLVPGIPSEQILYDSFNLTKDYYSVAQAIASKL